MDFSRIFIELCIIVVCLIQHNFGDSLIQNRKRSPFSSGLDKGKKLLPSDSGEFYIDDIQSYSDFTELTKKVENSEDAAKIIEPETTPALPTEVIAPIEKSLLVTEKNILTTPAASLSKATHSVVPKKEVNYHDEGPTVPKKEVQFHDEGPTVPKKEVKFHDEGPSVPKKGVNLTIPDLATNDSKSSIVGRKGVSPMYISMQFSTEDMSDVISTTDLVDTPTTMIIATENESNHSKPLTSDDTLFGSFFQKSSGGSNNNLVITGIVITIVLLLTVALVGYRKLQDVWSRRHYSRMDFLVDGMYDM